MAFLSSSKHCVLIYVIIFSTGNFGKAYEYPHLGAAGVVADEFLPEAESGETHGYLPEEGEEGVIGTNPSLIFDKALDCLKDKHIYTSCEETYRLTESGELNVPFEYTDEYCNGPCLIETHHVLDCIHHVFKDFLFYNRARVGDVRHTIESGCSYGHKRGDFNVAEHIEDDEAAGSNKVFNPILNALLLIIIMYNVFF